jgi:hypothetical protein
LLKLCYNVYTQDKIKIKNMEPTLLNVLYAILITCSALITVFVCLWILNVILLTRKAKNIISELGEKLNFIDDLTSVVRKKLSDSGLYLYLGKKIYEKGFDLFKEFKKAAPKNTKKKTTKSKTTTK